MIQKYDIIFYMGKKLIKAGIGLDIGTTTVQAELINLDTGANHGFEFIEAVSVLNDQRIYGADVMSRIACAREGKTQELFSVINKQVYKILQNFINKWDIQKIEQCVVSGNTAMLHFFANIDPSAMGEAPYTPEFLEEKHFNGSELSLPAEQVTLLPGISAFVGADIVSGLTYLDVVNTKGKALFVDIGTNGEIAVWNGHRLLCTSTAAGPCFEGESISYGSDLIDAIAIMKRQGTIDETGVITGEYAYKDFIVTQEIVRRFQLAKSAIYSGISVLSRTVGASTFGIETDQFNAVYIAGGMGFHINLENAAEIGLLPRGIVKTAPHLRREVCGNTSLKGAVRCLTDKGFLQRCKKCIALSGVIDLAVDREFADAYIENMAF